MKALRLHNARGSVLVLVAAAIFPIAAMLTFTIDVSHWFDYSRNLQNRADAAALAAGTAYGDICFRSAADQGDQWTGLQSVVGKWAQLYTGAGVGEPTGNLTYTDTAVAALPSNTGADGPGTGWDVSSYGYINNTQPGSPVPSPLTLQLGSLQDYFVRLNADNYADKGGVDFAMGDFCNADPAKDATDKHPGDPGAMADVKVTQRQLPNFIPIFNVHPNIEAHARVEVQQQQLAKGVRPIAVSDASYIPCVTANFLDADGNVITSEKLTRAGAASNMWATTDADAKQVSIPSGSTPPHAVTVQLFLNNCSTSSPTGQKYDYFNDKGQERQLGLVYINNWGSPSGTPTAPRIGSGGVTLTGSAKTECDPYFQTSSGACSVNVDAHIDFPTPGSGVSYFARAVVGTNPTSNFVKLSNTTGNEWTSDSAFSFASDSGPHEIHIFWAKLGGSVGNNQCDPQTDAQGNPNNPWANSNKNCQVDLGIQQRSFSGINGTNACDNPPFETGPMQWITVGDASGGSGANAYGSGSNPKLYVTTSIVGLSNSGSLDPPICLRVAEKTSHATGFVNCKFPGQPGGPADEKAVVQGCPPVQIDTRMVDGALICDPTNNPIDCVQNDPGQSPPILQSFADLIKDPTDPAGCEKNYWPAASGRDPNHVFSVEDKRAVIMIITAPTDMAVQHGTSDIPIRDFAVFYITGWSTKQGNVGTCTYNDPPPAGAGSGEIWGHWTSITVPSGLGSSNGKQCDFTRLGNCIAVLTR